jgi:sarcosine oxidase subunit beta
MVKTAEVIIIGAGVVGCSIAYHLAKLGCHDVIVLEKDTIGSGSTSKCPGGIRQQFSTETNIRLSMESVDFFQHFEDETGHSADFRQHGYLILGTTEEESELFHHKVALQRQLGLEVHLLSPEETREIVPVLNVQNIISATYCPTDGYADPYSVVQGFTSAARRLGVRIYEGIEVIDMKQKEGQILSVSADEAEFMAPVIVIASGAYAAQIGKMVGLALPIHPSRRHMFISAPFNKISRDTPMVVDFHSGFWFRREGQGIIFGMRNPDEPEGFNTSVDLGFLPAIGEVGSHYLPFLKDIGIARGQAGLHADTPDASAIMGKAPEVDGLFLACGFSGHGFMHSPAVGRIMAELILEGKAEPDISCLASDRFTEPVYQEERYFI